MKDVPLGADTKNEELTSHEDTRQTAQDKEGTDKTSWGTELDLPQQQKG